MPGGPGPCGRAGGGQVHETPILYVDDEPDHADTLKLALRGRGYSLTYSPDAASALRLLRSGYRPALVIIDWAMPGMNGTELLAVLKKAYPALPVILVSGRASFSDADEMLQLRPDALLGKPVDWSRHLGTIERVLAQYGAGGGGDRPQSAIGSTSPALRVAEAVQTEVLAWEERLHTTPRSLYKPTSSLRRARIFISYASEDSAFVDLLEDRLPEDGARCWRDRRSLLAGRIDKQIENAIAHHDVLVVVLSEASIASEWVRWEIEQARAVEKAAGRDYICPISIDRAWESWQGDPVLKREISKYHVLPFVGWQEIAAFDESFV